MATSRRLRPHELIDSLDCLKDAFGGRVTASDRMAGLVTEAPIAACRHAVLLIDQCWNAGRSVDEGVSPTVRTDLAIHIAIKRLGQGGRSL